MRYTRLNSLYIRRLFDPKRKKDVEEFAYFLQHNKWRTVCPFYLEDTWDNIPDMCRDKFTRQMLNASNKEPL